MSHTKHYYTYSYTDPTTNIVFYIGKGTNNRSTSHLRRAKGTARKSDLPVVDKVRSLLSNNLLPIITILTKYVNESEAFNEETKLIATIGRRNINTGPLLNLTDGGEGSSGRIWSEERKESWKGKNNPMFNKVPWKEAGLSNPMLNKKHSNKSKEKMSQKVAASYTTELREVRSQQITGSNNPSFGKPAKNRRSVIFRGILFSCIKHACDHFNVHKGIVYKEGTFP